MTVYEVWPMTGIIEEYWWRETAMEIADQMDAAGDGPTIVYQRADGVRTRLR